MTEAHSNELLLAQTGWLRALAVRLVGNDSRADDLAQEALVRALERPPRARDERALRAWLRRVMQNLVHSGMRGDGRRRAREEATAWTS